MKTFFNLLLMMAIAMPLMHAQKDDPPYSKWTLDMEIGIPINFESSTSFQYSSIGTTYRLDKWWALTANITYINEESSNQFRGAFYRDFLIESSKRTFRIENNNLVLNLGAQILIRMGQGDLFFRSTLGLGVVWGDLEMTEPDLGRNNISLEPSFGPYVTSNIGYTYWPVKRLGITLEAGPNSSFVQSRDSQQFSSFWTINLGASYRF